MVKNILRITLDETGLCCVDRRRLYAAPIALGSCSTQSDCGPTRNADHYNGPRVYGHRVLMEMALQRKKVKNMNA
jgi:hypothetical protein